MRERRWKSQKKTVGITFCRTFLRWVVDTEKCVSPYWSKVVVYQKLWQTELTARCFKDLKQICLVGSSYAGPERQPVYRVPVASELAPRVLDPVWLHC